MYMRTLAMAAGCAVTAVLTGAVLVPATVHAEQHQESFLCPAHEFCTFPNQNFGPTMSHTEIAAFDTCYTLPEKFRSYTNRTGKFLQMWDGESCRGNSQFVSGYAQWAVEPHVNGGGRSVKWIPNG